jgi:hypothetical protein
MAIDFKLPNLGENIDSGDVVNVLGWWWKGREEAEQKIGEILSMIDEGGDFAEIARAESDCPSGREGGDLGFFERGMMVPEFEAVCVERYAMIARALEDSKEQRGQLHRAIRDLRAILLRAADSPALRRQATSRRLPRDLAMRSRVASGRAGAYSSARSSDHSLNCS